MRCVISGIALATPQGATAQATWQRLLDGAVLRETGRVPLPPDSQLPRVSQLAIHVARDALDEAGWGANAIRNDRTALLIGTSKGPIEAWLAGQPTSAFGLAAVANDIAAAIGHGGGPRLTSSAACASGLHAVIRAKELLDSGRCDRAIVVAAESSIGPLFQATFKRLGVLADAKIGCRPFDVARQGFLLAEAAAAVCIERSDRPGAAVAATAMRSDAHHLTAPDPSGRGIEAVLRALAGGDIDLVHAHGTGTSLNDPAELAAIDRTLRSTPQQLVRVVSHKHALGHTQGAAGLIGVVLNLLAHRSGRIFGNANTSNPLSSSACISNAVHYFYSRSSVALAAGFGGPVVGVRLEMAE